MAKFSANKCCQPIYAAIHEAIKDLSKEQAVEALVEITDNCESQIEAIRDEIIDEESGDE